MKKSKIVFLSLSALLLSTIIYFDSCTKLADLLQYDFYMQSASIDVIIPPCLDTNINTSGTQSGNYNVDSFIKANTKNVLGLSNITSAKIQTCNIILQNPTATNNFANFKTCSASFNSNSNSTYYNVGASNLTDTYSESMNLNVDTTQELKGYFVNSNTFNYKVAGSLRRPVTDTLHAHITLTFKIHVQG